MQALRRQQLHCREVHQAVGDRDDLAGWNPCIRLQIVIGRELPERQIVVGDVRRAAAERIKNARHPPVVRSHGDFPFSADLLSRGAERIKLAWEILRFELAPGAAVVPKQRGVTAIERAVTAIEAAVFLKAACGGFVVGGSITMRPVSAPGPPPDGGRSETTFPIAPRTPRRFGASLIGGGPEQGTPSGASNQAARCR